MLGEKTWVQGFSYMSNHKLVELIINKEGYKLGEREIDLRTNHSYLSRTIVSSIGFISTINQQELVVIEEDSGEIKKINNSETGGRWEEVREIIGHEDKLWLIATGHNSGIQVMEINKDTLTVTKRSLILPNKIEVLSKKIEFSSGLYIVRNEKLHEYLMDYCWKTL